VHTDVVIKHRLRPEKHSPFRRFKTARQGCGLTLYHFSNFRSRFWKFSSSFQAQSSRLSNTLPYSTTTPKISLLYNKPARSTTSVLYKCPLQVSSVPQVSDSTESTTHNLIAYLSQSSKQSLLRNLNAKKTTYPSIAKRVP
jgi:hypothetical protein